MSDAQPALPRLIDYRDKVLDYASENDRMGEFAERVDHICSAIVSTAQVEGLPGEAPPPTVQFDETQIIKSGSDLFVLREVLTVVESTYVGQQVPELEAMRLRVEEAIVQLAVGPPEQPQA